MRRGRGSPSLVRHNHKNILAPLSLSTFSRSPPPHEGKRPHEKNLPTFYRPSPLHGLDGVKDGPGIAARGFAVSSSLTLCCLPPPPIGAPDAATASGLTAVEHELVGFSLGLVGRAEVIGYDARQAEPRARVEECLPVKLSDVGCLAVFEEKTQHIVCA